MIMEKFNYAGSVKKVEDMLSVIENPQTAVDECGKLIDKARKELDKCYAYLRSEREACGDIKKN